MVLNELIASTIAIILAELGDKSHVITLLLSSKYKDHIRVFIGIMSAFFITIILAILFGKFFSDFILSKEAKVLIASTMIIFGIYTFLSHKKGPIKISKHSPLVSSFIMIFFAEMGDKSLFVSGIYGAKLSFLLVLFSHLLGLALITYATIFIGRKFNKHIHPKVVHYVGGSIFIILGVLTFVGVY